MIDFDLTYKPYGNQAILIEWPTQIKKQIRKDIIAFQKVIKDQKIQDTVVAFNSLLIILKQPIRNFDLWVEKLKSVYPNRTILEKSNKKIWEIPVCYDVEFGIDLEEMSKKLDLSIEEIIKLHSDPNYLVYFIGFQPGFLYLGGLNPDIYFPRKAIPRMNVTSGSVAIGGSQTGIYPQESSGGWNIIGRTHISFFDVNLENPCFAQSGDYINFKPITRKEYESFKNSSNSKPKYVLK